MCEVLDVVKTMGFKRVSLQTEDQRAMKEHSFAISVSLLFHVIIVALFLRVPFDQYIKPKLMVLDSSLEKGRAAVDAEIVKS